MSKYTITAGQNLFDVALHIYGSIEGITDLMMNNPDLSLDTTLRAGDELVYTDDFLINAETVAYYKTHGITPAGGERQVYYKSTDKPLLAEFRLAQAQTSAQCVIAGAGVIQVDWGDNSPLQTVTLSAAEVTLSHFFDNAINSTRRVRIYGSFEPATVFDISGMSAQAMFLLHKAKVERLIAVDCRMNISWMELLDGVFEMVLQDIDTNDLTPLLKCKSLMRLDLSGHKLRREVLDRYLIELVRQYYGRRNCEVITSCVPSGEYRQPERDEDLNYILRTGMEAIWVLTHEPAWNEAGYWKFIIDNQTFTTEPEE